LSCVNFFSLHRARTHSAEREGRKGGERKGLADRKTCSTSLSLALEGRRESRNDTGATYSSYFFLQKGEIGVFPAKGSSRGGGEKKGVILAWLYLTLRPKGGREGKEKRKHATSLHQKKEWTGLTSICSGGGEGGGKERIESPARGGGGGPSPVETKGEEKGSPLFSPPVI